MLIRYGAYLFSSIGKAAFLAERGCKAICPGGETRTAVLILSSQGDSEEIISGMNSYKKAGAALISITNAEPCPAAQISDINFPCYMPEVSRDFGNGEMEPVSQIPTVYLLELILGRMEYEVPHERSCSMEIVPYILVFSIVFHDFDIYLIK